MLACNSMYNLIDPHYTEKVAICCVDDKLNYSLYSLADLIRMKL